jgi:hypothetical protein
MSAYVDVLIGRLRRHDGDESDNRLGKAVQREHNEHIEFLVGSSKDMLHTADQHGRYPLELAIWHVKPNTCGRMIDAGAKLERTSSSLGETVSMYELALVVNSKSRQEKPEGYKNMLKILKLACQKHQQSVRSKEEKKLRDEAQKRTEMAQMTDLSNFVQELGLSDSKWQIAFKFIKDAGGSSLKDVVEHGLQQPFLDHLSLAHISRGKAEEYLHMLAESSEEEPSEEEPSEEEFPEEPRSWEPILTKLRDEAQERTDMEQMTDLANFVQELRLSESKRQIAFKFIKDAGGSSLEDVVKYGLQQSFLDHLSLAPIRRGKAEEYLHMLAESSEEESEFQQRTDMAQMPDLAFFVQELGLSDSKWQIAFKFIKDAGGSSLEDVVKYGLQQSFLDHLSLAHISRGKAEEYLHMLAESSEEESEAQQRTDMAQMSDLANFVQELGLSDSKWQIAFKFIKDAGGSSLKDVVEHGLQQPFLDDLSLAHISRGKAEEYLHMLAESSEEESSEEESFDLGNQAAELYEREQLLVRMEGQTYEQQRDNKLTYIDSASHPTEESLVCRPSFSPSTVTGIRNCKGKEQGTNAGNQECLTITEQEDDFEGLMVIEMCKVKISCCRRRKNN